MLLMLDDMPDVLSVKELYDVLPLGMNTVRELVRSGAIRSIKVGSRYIVPKKAVIDFLNNVA